jgi:glycosyltransferase involved in cell wall biosynthesis/Flp pilus assembly protein TadD
MPATVSLCLIVRNEEAHIADCLRSAADLAVEIIVVDTGSTDRTKQIAAELGAKVFDFPWIDDFSAARNEAVKHASGEWIFWLDADDRIDDENRGKLRSLLKSLPEENVAYILRCVSLAPDGKTTLSIVDHPRIFRKQPGVGWKYRVHEQVLPSILRQGGKMQRADVVIHHAGYQDPATRRRKDERNLRLLRLDAAEHPNDHAVLFHLGMTLVVLGQAAEAIAPLRRTVELARPDDPTVRKSYTLMVQAHRRLDQNDQAVALCEEALKKFPDDTELLFQEAVLRVYRRDLAGGERSLLRLLTTPPADYLAVAVDPELRGVKARFNLAVVYRDQGRAAEAEALWQQVIAEKPDFTEAWIGLADLYLTHGRRDAAAELARRLRANPQRAGEAASVEARCLAAINDFAGARRVLEQALAAAPGAVGLNLALANVLLAEDRDHAAAEKALRAVLAVEPNHTQARQNLETLQRRLAQQVAKPAAGRPRVSLTMIVKNEEASLPNCLRSAAGLFDEIIVVDTGSTDRTREVAARLGAKVFDFPWRDDFAAARNESLRHATGDWVFWLDADETLDEANRGKLLNLFNSLKGDKNAYVMMQLCLRQAPLPGEMGGDTAVEQVRLFRRLPGITWEHRVYEQVLPSVRRLGGDLRHADITIHHAGYQDAAGHRAKIERNLRLAQREQAERPNDPYVLYLLGMFQQKLGWAAESVSNLQRAAERCPASATYSAKLHALLAQGLAQQGRRPDALAAGQRGRRKHPADAELACQEAGLLMDTGDLEKAEMCLRRLVGGPAGAAAVATDPSQRAWAHHQLALIERRRGRAAEAEAHWRAAVAERPDYPVAWLELGELYLGLKRWDNVEEIALRAEGPLGRPDDAAVLRSRVLLFRREFSAARTLLEDAIRRFPQAIRPRQALTHVLLYEGRDTAAAEAALRDLLAFDPGNPQALGNLQALLRRRPAAPRRCRVSLTVVVRDEQAHIAGCLASAVGLCDEIVVVDTGSKDRTKEIATRFGARVIDFLGVDDIAAARNESIQHATGDWVFWLDAADRLDAESRARLEALFASLGTAVGAYLMKCVHVTDQSSGSGSVIDDARLFRRHPQVRWEHGVHAQVLPSVERLGGHVQTAEVTVRHVGSEHPAGRRRQTEGTQ